MKYKLIFSLVVLATIGAGCNTTTNNNVNTRVVNEPVAAEFSNANVDNVNADEVLPTVTTAIDSDKKLFTYELQLADCDGKFNTDAPSTTVTYVNGDRDMQIELPYNPNWGTDEYRVLPYYPTQDGIAFGMLSAMEGCGWMQDKSLHFTEARSVESILADPVKDDDLPPTQVKQIELNGNQAVEYVGSGLCNNAFIEIPADGYNILLANACNDDPTGLETVGATLQLGLDDEVFDACGKPGDYVDEAWYPTFAAHNMEDIHELCYAPDEHTVILLSGGGYGQLSWVTKYDTETDLFQTAPYNYTGSGFPAAPTEFGERTGDVITLKGETGDAGCMKEVTYEYNYKLNTVRETSDYSYCTDGTTGELTSEVTTQY